MNFFADRSPSTGDGEEFEELRARHPSAVGAPTDWILPAALPWTRKLGEGPVACVALERVRCWPNGVTLDLVLFLRRASRDGRGMSMLFHRGPYHQPKEGDLRFGVLFSDGRRVTNLDESSWPPFMPGGDPEQPKLWPGGGGGGQFHFSFELFLSPLPPDGPLTIVVEWPDQEISETHTELDGAQIRAAAEEAVEVWPDLPPPTAEEVQRTTMFSSGFGHAIPGIKREEDRP